MVSFIRSQQDWNTADFLTIMAIDNERIDSLEQVIQDFVKECRCNYSGPLAKRQATHIIYSHSGINYPNPFSGKP